MAGFFSKLLKRNAAEVEPPTPPSGDPFDMDWGSGHPTDAVVYQLTSVLMRYPSEETRALLPELTALAQETGNDYLMRGVARIKTWYEATEPRRHAGRIRAGIRPVTPATPSTCPTGPKATPAAVARP